MEMLNNQKPEEDFLTAAEMMNQSSVVSASVTASLGKDMFPDMDISELVKEVQGSIKDVNSGNMKEMEAMLVGQAKALQTIFASLMRKGNAQSHLKQYSVMMGLALKAQSQSRATIQALTELKYPRQVLITKQANISQGHQQVNNGCAPARELAVTQNELSGASNELPENPGTPEITITANNELEAMGEIDGPQNRGGKNQKRRKF